MANQINYVADWNARLLSRLYRQHRLPNFQAFATNVLAPQSQAIEDAFQTLLTLPSIDDSSGVNLDVIGLIVQQQREGLDDPMYRLALKARIQANRSCGTPENLYTVLSLLLTAPVGSLHYKRGGIASFSIKYDVPIADTLVPLVIEFIGDSKMAGVRAIFIWQDAPDADMFTFAEATMLIAAASTGATMLTLATTQGMPQSGALALDPFLTNAETVSYTLTGDGKTVTCSALANNHAMHACAELVGDDGLGFGDSSNPATGGNYAGAAQAS